MGTTNTYAQLLPRQQQQSLRILEDLQPHLLFSKFGARDELAQRSGKKAVFRRYFDLPAPVAPGIDGAKPVGQQLTFEDIWTSIVSFPSAVPLTKDDILYHEDDLVSIASKKIVRQLAQTDDIYMFKMARAGNNVRYAGGATTRAGLNSAPTQADFDLVVRDLENANVPKVSQIIPAGMKVSTEPVRESYVAFVHPMLRGDIVRTAGFIPAEKYASSGLLDPKEMGATPNGIRFIPSTIISSWPVAATSVTSATFIANGVAGTGTTADVFPIIIFGQDAWGHLDLKDYTSMSVKVIKPGTPAASSVTDPMGENGVVASDLKTGGVILDQRRIVRLEALANNTWT